MKRKEDQGGEKYIFTHDEKKGKANPICFFFSKCSDGTHLLLKAVAMFIATLRLKISQSSAQYLRVASRPDWGLMNQGTGELGKLDLKCFQARLTEKI